MGMNTVVWGLEATGAWHTVSGVDNEAVVYLKTITYFLTKFNMNMIHKETRKSLEDEIPERIHRSILLPLLRLTPPTEGLPCDDLRIILHGGQMMAKVQNGEKILPKVLIPRVRHTNVTDDRRICDSKDPNVT